MSSEKTTPERVQTGATGITRRDFIKVGGTGLAGAVVLGVAGCGGGGNQGGVSSGGTGGGNGSGGGGKNDLQVGYDQEPSILNGYIVGGDLAATGDMIAGVLESPLQIKPDLSFTPQLAQDMPKLVSKNPQVVEYKLKDGVTWSDGKPLTSADAKWTFEQIMKKKKQDHHPYRVGKDLEV